MMTVHKQIVTATRPILNRAMNKYEQITRTVEVTIELDFEAIADTLGGKAAFNKSRKAVEMGGLVCATAREVVL
jgi:hypothetical protein